MDELKIDRSFVSRIEEGEREAAFVRTIISLAKSMHIEVVAEGIEQPGQQQFLHSVGCEYGQGYLYSRPLPANAIEAFVQQSKQVRPLLSPTPKKFA